VEVCVCNAWSRDMTQLQHGLCVFVCACVREREREDTRKGGKPNGRADGRKRRREGDK